DFGTLLFLGTYPATAAITFPQANDFDRFHHNAVFAMPLSGDERGKSAPIPGEVRRLFAAWLGVRTDPVPLRIGMNLALYHGIREALPKARAAATDKGLAPE